MTTNKSRLYWTLALGSSALLAALFVLYLGGANKQAGAPTRFVVNEAARTLLYLPLYHAKEQGYFAKEGLEVSIVTGGTATNAVAAMLSGEADIAQADPMYGPIAREKGGDVVVLGQIVGRVAVWAVAKPTARPEFARDTLTSAIVVTHPRPMTAFLYTTARLEELGLHLGQDVRVIESKPGTELAAFEAESTAGYLVTVEPAVSIAESKGARVVYSWPAALGDRVFSGLLARRAVVNARKKEFSAALRAYQHALDDIQRNDPRVMNSAKAFFPQVDDVILTAAIKRLATEKVFPVSIAISPESWNSAVSARIKSGDLKGAAPFQENVISDLSR